MIPRTTLRRNAPRRRTGLMLRRPDSQDHPRGPRRPRLARVGSDGQRACMSYLLGWLLASIQTGCGAPEVRVPPVVSSPATFSNPRGDGEHGAVPKADCASEVSALSSIEEGVRRCLGGIGGRIAIRITVDAEWPATTSVLVMRPPAASPRDPCITDRVRDVLAGGVAQGCVEFDVLFEGNGGGGPPTAGPGDSTETPTSCPENSGLSEVAVYRAALEAVDLPLGDERGIGAADRAGGTHLGGQSFRRAVAELGDVGDDTAANFIEENEKAACGVSGSGGPA